MRASDFGASNFSVGGFGIGKFGASNFGIGNFGLACVCVSALSCSVLPASALLADSMDSGLATFALDSHKPAKIDSAKTTHLSAKMHYNVASNKTYNNPIGGGATNAKGDILAIYLMPPALYQSAPYHHSEIAEKSNQISRQIIQANALNKPLTKNKVAIRFADISTDSSDFGGLDYLDDFTIADDANTNADNTSTSSTATDLESKTLNKVTAKHKRSQEPTQRYQSTAGDISQRMIESNPSGNGDITSLLRILPNVQYDNSQLKSTTPGEIDPAKISISGGLHYQNLFTLDGVGINNDINPAGTASGGWDGIPGNSQGLNIDTSLLESIKVQDSNVGAAYGGFTGGVVEANTRRPVKRFGANISYQITQGDATPGAFSMTNYHIYDEDAEALNNFLNSSSESNQPNFTKHLIRASAESKISDRFGVLASFTTTQSFIPLRANSSISSSQASPVDPTDQTTRERTQKRQSYNYLLKTYYDPSDNLRLELTYTYAPQYNEIFMPSTKDDRYIYDSGGHNVGLKTIWQNGLGMLTNTLSYGFLDYSIDANYDATKYWYPSESKNWGRFSAFVREGGYIPSESTQHTASNKLIQDFTPFKLANTTHSFQVGLEIGYQYVKRGYAKDFDFARNNSSAVQITTEADRLLCQQTDIQWCNTSPAYSANGVWQYGQYIRHIDRYKQGKIDINNTLGAVFLQDDIAITLGRAGSINARPGLRVDADSYMGKITFAPRLSLSYEFPWNTWQRGHNFATQITGGANRYYGRNIFAYALADKIEALEYRLRRSNPGVSWDEVEAMGRECSSSADYNNCISYYSNTTKFSQLKVPYTDELMVGFAQRFFSLDLGAKYIYREGKDDIRYVRSDYVGLPSDPNYAQTYYTYTNEGKSWTDVITVSLQNSKPLQILGVQNLVLFAFDWTNVKRNFTDYASSMTQDQLQDNDILWEGQVVPYSQRPASNFVRPYTLRLTTTHTFRLWRTKWLWNNFFRYRSAYDAVAKIHTAGTSYDRCATDSRYCPREGYDANHNDKDQFVAQRIRDAFTWDMRVGFEVNVWRGNTLYVNIDIYNILDAKNPTISTTNYAGTSSAPTIAYEVGRQFWA
ncbi:hypothetical protein BKN38_04710 [Helicobacter sp. CLO-3]|uniref:Plug domain-containing protein n=2 Tax=Helicobacter TaxID=209 RepID=UPI000805326E|nr:Plug domain-containing protein [Helicobacter sp. CLO-3]OBV29247.1 hypothetical protein BA723_06440 [Helicobacter sp. CLO-3]OHU83893.1 hypothetical protein BKN38_04710 [Helicobacter sp. CLO-3]